MPYRQYPQQQTFAPRVLPFQAAAAMPPVSFAAAPTVKMPEKQPSLMETLSGQDRTSDIEKIKDVIDQARKKEMPSPVLNENVYDTGGLNDAWRTPPIVPPSPPVMPPVLSTPPIVPPASAAPIPPAAQSLAPAGLPNLANVNPYSLLGMTAGGRPNIGGLLSMFG